MRIAPCLLIAAALPLLAQAQGAAPDAAAAPAQAQAAEAPAEAPAVNPAPVRRHRAAKRPAEASGTQVAAPVEEGIGTTLIGDRESPLGLYLTPWKNEYAERGMDRPPQNFQEAVAPVDPKVFNRQLEYYDVIVDYRQAEAGSQK